MAKNDWILDFEVSMELSHWDTSPGEWGETAKTAVMWAKTYLIPSSVAKQHVQTNIFEI